MVSLFKKGLEPTPLPEAPVDAMPLPAFDPLQLGGGDVNLVLMVQENAPRRLKEIKRELDEMERRTIALNKESKKLERLLAAVAEVD